MQSVKRRLLLPRRPPTPGIALALNPMGNFLSTMQTCLKPATSDGHKISINCACFHGTNTIDDIDGNEEGQENDRKDE